MIDRCCRPFDLAALFEVDLIVTGDHDLLAQESFQGIPIITPAAYLASA